ncbi:MAG: hypothetical protein ACI8RZ_007506 [Myxococcota bacterium]|jgi:hypothetical protein
MRWLLLPGLIGCGEKEDDSGDIDSGIACGSTQGFVYGTVTFDGAPAGKGTVFAEDTSGTQVTAVTTSAGSYELNLDPGDWTLFANQYHCYSEDITVSVVECEEHSQDILIKSCDTADKPNLYLYPQVDTPTSVSLSVDRKQALVASDPPYDGGWHGIAHPDGTFTIGDDRAPFLFYEVSLAPWQPRVLLQREEGFCVSGKHALWSLAGLMEDHGFNAAEVDDFVEAWRVDLPDAPVYAVYPQHEVAGMAELHIEPDLPVDRLWLLIEAEPACTVPQEAVVVPMNRTGAHGVEWGVVLEGFVL